TAIASSRTGGARQVRRGKRNRSCLDWLRPTRHPILLLSERTPCTAFPQSLGRHIPKPCWHRVGGWDADPHLAGRQISRSWGRRRLRRRRWRVRLERRRQRRKGLIRRERISWFPSGWKLRWLQ